SHELESLLSGAMEHFRLIAVVVVYWSGRGDRGHHCRETPAKADGRTIDTGGSVCGRTLVCGCTIRLSAVRAAFCGFRNTLLREHAASGGVSRDRVLVLEERGTD